MKKSYQECYFYLYSILIFGVSYVIGTGGSSAEKTSSNKIFPLILMKESEVLELPNAVSLESALCIWKKIDFHADLALYERYFCGADNKIQKKKIKKARKKSEERNLKKPTPTVSFHCLFKKSHLDLKKLFAIMPHCPVEPEPFISKIFQTEKKIINSEDDDGGSQFEWSSCGFTGENKLYRFGYQIWLDSATLNPNTKLEPPLTKSMALPNENIIDYEIYRFCYDDSKQEVLYTKHKILSPGLLLNENLTEKSEETYPMNILKYDNEELDFQNIKKIHDQVNGLNTSHDLIRDENSENISTSNLLDYRIEKLIPQEDFAFILWKKPTFHIVNEKLMHKELIKSWNKINEIIQSRAKTVHAEFNIYTGTFDILPEDDSNESAKTEDETKIPQIWVKIVQHRVLKPEYKIDFNNGIAIIANNLLNDDLEKMIISEYCDGTYTFQFHPSEDESFTSEPDKYTYIRTCKVTEKIQKLFGLDLQITNTVELF